MDVITYPYCNIDAWLVNRASKWRPKEIYRKFSHGINDIGGMYYMNRTYKFIWGHVCNMANNFYN